MKIRFYTDFTVQLPPAKGEKMIAALEKFITDVSKIGPMPKMTVEVDEE